MLHRTAAMLEIAAERQAWPDRISGRPDGTGRRGLLVRRSSVRFRPRAKYRRVSSGRVAAAVGREGATISTDVIDVSTYDALELLPADPAQAGLMDSPVRGISPGSRAQTI
jgi:hypothetical protein